MFIIQISFNVFHNPLAFGWVKPFSENFDNLDGCPGHKDDDGNFLQKDEVYSGDVDLVSEEDDGQEVDEEGEDLTAEDNLIEMGDCGVGVEYFDDDQGAEGDGHDLGEGVCEEPEGEEHDDWALVDAFPQPDQEGFVAELSAFLQGLVQLGELSYFFLWHVLVEDYAENGEHCVDGCVAEHEVAVVDRNGDRVEDEGENALDDGDDKSTVDDELGHDRSVLVGESSVPQDKPREVLELHDWKIWGEGCLFTLFSDDPDTDVCLKDHTDIISSISDSQGHFSSVVFDSFGEDCLLSGWDSAADDGGRCCGKGVEILCLRL